MENKDPSANKGSSALQSDWIIQGRVVMDPLSNEHTLK